MGLMHGDGGARRRLGATRIDEDSARGAATNMLQSARLSARVSVCVCVDAHRKPEGIIFVSIVCLARARVLVFHHLNQDSLADWMRTFKR